MVNDNVVELFPNPADKPAAELAAAIDAEIAAEVYGEVAEPVETEVRPVLYKFTNAVESHELDDLLAMFYIGVANNTIGIMQAWNLEKEKEELILVGVELDAEGKADLYPLAHCLAVEDTRNYLSPDGKGGFYDPRDPGEVAAAKEGMKSFTESVVE
jgi:hypothetical protein